MRNVGITIIDSYFAFVLHITLICSRASQTLDLVIRTLKHGLSDDAAVVLYLCHSSVNYSSMFWLSGLPTSLGRAIISFKRCGCALSGSWDAVLVNNSFMSQFMSRVHGLRNLECRRRVADRPSSTSSLTTRSTVGTFFKGSIFTLPSEPGNTVCLSWSMLEATTCGTFRFADVLRKQICALVDLFAF